jgi:FKBP-type peptidyl-prolyl cis-trans isomerase
MTGRCAMRAALATAGMLWLASGRPALAAEPAAELPAARPAAESPAARRPGAAGPLALDTPAETLGYSLGLRIGSRIAADFKEHDPPVDPAALARGLADAVLGAPPRLDEQRIRTTLQAFDARMRQRQDEFERRMVQAAKVNLAKATEFARANASKPGIVTRKSGLQYEVLREGSGPSPTPQDSVVAHYRGTHLDGSEFDATDPQGEPTTFPLQGVVAGWQEALPLMKAGSKWRIYIPPDLGYGAEGSPPVIEPNEFLIFEIELVKVLPSR